MAADIVWFRTVQSDTYTPRTELMTVLHCRRPTWMPNLNAIVLAMEPKTAPPGAPPNLHATWYEALAGRMEGEDSNSEEDEEDWSV